MTLKYDELMDRIEVTPEMRQRILKNIETADLTPDKGVAAPSPEAISGGSRLLCSAHHRYLDAAPKAA